VRSGAEDVPNDAVAAAKRLTPEVRERWLSQLEQLVGGSARPSWDGMMSWNELRQVQAAGHEIGSHSSSHPILPLIEDAELDREIAGSRKTLERQLGSQVSSFCYPNGDHDPRVIAAVQRAGYRFAVTTRYGLNASLVRTGSSDPFVLKRCDMQGRYARDAGGAFASAGLLLRLTGQLPGMA
jgi:peptidoglycan/xylan/chitin deacetylase (PgdA/CDA1 family)